MDNTTRPFVRALTGCVVESLHHEHLHYDVLPATTTTSDAHGSKDSPDFRTFYFPLPSPEQPRTRPCRLYTGLRARGRLFNSIIHTGMRVQYALHLGTRAFALPCHAVLLLCFHESQDQLHMSGKGDVNL